MTMRRPVVLAVVTLAQVACGFPALTYDGGTGGSDASAAGDAATTEAGADSASDAATSDGQPASDAPPSDGGGPSDGGADGPSCDEDDDKFLAEGGTCGGNDCCDTDKNAHPGQKAFFADASACGSFDYDCNGKEDPEFPISLTCGGTAATGCTGGSGYLSDPGCGNGAPYYTCVGNGLLACKPGQPISQQQRCH